MNTCGRDKHFILILLTFVGTFPRVITSMEERSNTEDVTDQQLLQSVMSHDLAAVQRTFAAGANPNMDMAGKPLLLYIAQNYPDDDSKSNIIKAFLRCSNLDRKIADDAFKEIRKSSSEESADLITEFKQFAARDTGFQNNTPRTPSFTGQNGARDYKNVRANSTILSSSSPNVCLILALQGGQLELAQKAIAEMKADPDCLTGGCLSMPVIVIPIWQNNPKIVKMLITCGANPCFRTDFGLTPVEYAITAFPDRSEVINELAAGISKKTINIPNHRGLTLLHQAVMTGKLKLVEILMKAGADATVNDSFQRTPLELAYRLEFNDIAEFLKSQIPGAEEKLMVSLSPTLAKTTLEKVDWNSLCEAIEQNRPDLISLFVKIGHCNVANENGDTLLHVSAQRGSPKIVKILAMNGANIHIANNAGWTALHYAAERGILKMVKMLLKKGADANALVKDLLTTLHIKGKSSGPLVRYSTGEKWTPLHLASWNGHDAIVAALLKKGAHVNVHTNHNMTPLHNAAARGHKQIVTALVKAKASVDAQSENGWTPLHYALMSGHTEIAEELAKAGAADSPPTYTEMVNLLLDSTKGEINAIDSKANTALHIAAKKGYVELSKLLILNKKEWINAQNLEGDTPLHLAISNSHLEIAQLLLDSNAEVKFKNIQGYTALHAAVKNNLFEIIDQIIPLCSHINATDNEGMTALHLAASKGYVAIIQKLIKKGANIHLLDVNNKTALHVAAINGSVAAVQALIEAGADVNARNKDGMTPLHYAASEGHSEVTQVLVNAGGNSNALCLGGRTPLFYAIRSVAQRNRWDNNYLHDNIGTVKILAQNNATVDILDPESGKTPLLLAIDEGELEMVRELLTAGASVNSRLKDCFSFSALHIAAANCRTQGIVELLIKSGLNVNCLDEKGRTPLHIAALFRNEDALAELLASSARVDARDELGKTPLHYAAQNSDRNIIETLIRVGANIEIKDNEGSTADDFVPNSGCYHDIEASKTISCFHKLIRKLFADERNAKTDAILFSTSSSPIFELTVRRAATQWNQSIETIYKSLWAAAKSGNLNDLENAITRLKFANGAEKFSLDVRNEYKETPLHVAVYSGHLEIVKVLIGYGATVDAQQRDALTPLHLAALLGHTKIAELLIEKGANTKALSKRLNLSGDQETPLRLAARYGHRKLVKILAHETDITTSINCIKAASDSARQGGQLDIVHYLNSILKQEFITVFAKGGV